MLFKSLLFIALSSISILQVRGQEAYIKGLEKSVKLLQTQKSSTGDLSFIVNNQSYVVSDVSVERLANDNLILHSPEDQASTINLVKNESGFHGTFIDKQNNKAYLIRQTKDGAVYFKTHNINEIKYACNFEEAHAHKTTTPLQSRGYIGNSNTIGNVFQLESRPGAPYCIFLDFDGNASNGKYSGFGNNSYTVAGVSDAYAKIVWEQISDDFTQFDVNVTTNESVYNTYQRSNKVLCAFAEFGLPGWKGIAYVGSFGDGRASLVDIAINPSINDAVGDARTGSHEIGHTLGLSHDGGGGDPYYSGHGEYVPIMGSGSRPVSHWSMGEFKTGNNHEDDIAIIAQSLNFIPDDIPNYTDLNISSTGFVDPTINKGIISSRADIDKFKFTTTHAGELFIEAKPGIDKSNLDITLTLTDAAGNSIAIDRPVGKRSAMLQIPLPTGGTYYLEVDGGGELGVNDGWSDYSSQGYYEVNGYITGNINIVNDIELISLEGLGDNCGESITPVIEIKNKGAQTINNFTAKVYVDGNLAKTENITTNLPSGSTEKLNLSPLPNQGDHEVAVELSLSNGLDQLEYNNQKTKPYNLSPGNAVRFSTNYLDFTGEAPFMWSILDNGNEIASSKNIQVQEISVGEISQTTCVTADCYKIQITSEYNTCESYPTYTGGTHTGGDIVVIDNVLYEAKWWNTDHPTASSWKKIGACINDETELKLYNPNSSDVFVNISASEVNKNFQEEFCVSKVTSTQEQFTSIIKVFPNPSNGIFSIQSSEDILGYQIINTYGQVVSQSNTVTQEKNVDINYLSAGIYTVVLKLQNQTVTKSIVIQ